MDKEQAKKNIRSCLSWQLYIDRNLALEALIRQDSVSCERYKKICDDLIVRIDGYCVDIDKAKDEKEIMNVLENIDRVKP